MRFTSAAGQERALDAVGGTAMERIPRANVVRVRLDPGVSAAAARTALERRSDVVFAEPNRTYELYAAPNDTLYAQLWGLPAIGAPASRPM